MVATRPSSPKVLAIYCREPAEQRIRPIRVRRDRFAIFIPVVVGEDQSRRHESYRSLRDKGASRLLAASPFRLHRFPMQNRLC